jgi:chorismate-pyruvate lyase
VIYPICSKGAFFAARPAILSLCARALLPVLSALAAATVSAAQPPAWMDTPVARLEALALIETLSAEILANTSATLTLERWCRIHGMAENPLIVAHRIADAYEAPTAAQRQNLQITAQEPVQYRRVELTCGKHVLSVADNWYVPDRLTPEMIRLLDRTQMPFGRVVQPLAPHRQTIEVKLLWFPLPEGWEQSAAGATVKPSSNDQLDIPAALFEHRAILYTSEHRPIAEVHEIYQRDILAFPEPQLPTMKLQSSNR